MRRLPTEHASGGIRFAAGDRPSAAPSAPSGEVREVIKTTQSPCCCCYVVVVAMVVVVVVVGRRVVVQRATHLRCPHSQHQTSSHERPAQSHVTCVVGRIIHAARGPTVSRSSTPDLPLAAPCGGLATCWAPTSSQLGAGPARPWARWALPQQRTYPCQQAGVGLGSAASPSCRSDASRRRARDGETA